MMKHKWSNVFIFIYLFISSSIDPLQGQRPTGRGSSQGTLNSYRDYYWILRVKITLKYIVLDLKLEYTRNTLGQCVFTQKCMIKAYYCTDIGSRFPGITNSVELVQRVECCLQ
jgi:hypothetical protein